MDPHLRRGPAPPHLRRDQRGSAALEFALVAIPFITFLVVLLEIGYDFFAQVALDYGLEIAARQIQVGKAQDADTASQFKALYLCPALTRLLPCSSITVNVVPIKTDYFIMAPATFPTNASGKLDTSGFTYCPGMPNQLMLVQAVYTSPSLVVTVLPTMAIGTAGGLERATLSSTAFINENFPLTAAPPTGC